MAQGGQFAFVLHGAAKNTGIIHAPVNDNVTATVVLPMVPAPLVVLATRRLISREASSMDGVEADPAHHAEAGAQGAQ